MNSILEDKLKKLNDVPPQECWYIVKQEPDFCMSCYLVSFLEKYQNETQNESLENFVGDQLEKLVEIKPNIKKSVNYRALRVAVFYGLITMKTSGKYDDAAITDTFKEITSRCNGEYEKIDLYKDIIQRQIEKMFISSEIDTAKNDAREKYRLYPVMLLYKVLIELGRTTGKYEISIAEYRYIVATTEKFQDFIETLLLIKLMRKEGKECIKKFENLKNKFDNRFNLVLKQLDTLECDKEFIRVKEDKIAEVAKKVFIFEKNPNIFNPANYLEFLGSTKSLFELDDFENNKNDKMIESGRITTGSNILLYGVPGSGKSWTIEHEYCTSKTKVERVVFHPDYTNADFIGQILPVVDPKDGMVTYEFKSGPFTNILRDAYRNPTVPYVLVIEEINRGNAPAIFGDIFQLLDRSVEDKCVDGIIYFRGTSEYGITNENIAKVVYNNRKHKVRIPSNLSIIGTMNTSDQNVFTLDTAFQRRWNMRLVENSFDNVRPSLAKAKILDTKVTWEKFCETINELIIGCNARMASAEDKRLGVYFIHEDDLKKINIKSTGDYTSTRDELNKLLKAESMNKLNSAQEKRLKELRKAIVHNSLFPEKVIKYLWNDAFKFNHEVLFDTKTMDNLEEVIRTFIYNTGNDRFKIFKDSVQDSLGLNK